MGEKKKRELEEFLNGLTDEQKEKAMACKTPEELTALLDELGAAVPEELRRMLPAGELSDEELDAVSGGVRVVTEGEVDMWLNIAEPYTIYPASTGRWSSIMEYMFSWSSKPAIRDLSGDRRFCALEYYLGSGWQDACTEEVYKKLMGVE